MIRLDTFVSLENSLTQRLSETLAWENKILFDTIEAELKKRDYAKASELANQLDLTTTAQDCRKYIDWITNLAMLFGASMVTSRPGTSVVALGHEKTLIEQAATTFVYMLTNQGGLYLRTQALQLIAQRRLLQEASDVQKAEPKLDSFDPNQRILLPFDSFMEKSGKAFFNMASSLHTSRVSAYGFTAEADALDMEFYQINEQLDARICPVCSFMHGKKFKVEDARRLLDVVLRVSSTSDLKALQPWPSQSKNALKELRDMSTEELVSKGWHIPPYHPRCRGLLARVGRSPTLQQIENATVPEQGPYTASQDDFLALGYQTTPEHVDLWNKAVNVSPAQASAALQNKPLDDYLDKLMSSYDSGVTDLKFSEKKQTVTMATEGATATFDPLKSTLKLISGIPDDWDSAKKMMQSVYTLAQDTNLNYISTRATAAMGYRYARGGFIPDYDGWVAMKQDIGATAWFGGLSPEKKAILADLFASESPYTVYELADLGKLGELALKSTEWQAYLPVTDTDAVARFLTYFGG